jgi:hypothetical protein
MDNFRLYMFSILLLLTFSLYHAVNTLLEKNGVIAKFIAILVIGYSVYLAVNRNTYLPFLGPTVLPMSLLKESSSYGGSKKELRVPVDIDAPENTIVMYWASMPNESIIQSPYEAYSKFENAGVTTVNNKKAFFEVDCPSSYKIPSSRVLSPHIHYRIVYPNGIAGSVRTVYVDCAKNKN